jgi:hypothetical protein
MIYVLENPDGATVTFNHHDIVLAAGSRLQTAAVTITYGETNPVLKSVTFARQTWEMYIKEGWKRVG